MTFVYTASFSSIRALFSSHFSGRYISLLSFVCQHIHLFFSVEAQMYILLILFPAVKLQRGIKDPPHSPLRKSLQETHTHTHTLTLTLTRIHTYTMAGQRPCRKLHRGIPARPGQIIFPPYFLFLCTSLSFLASPKYSSHLWLCCLTHEMIAPN